MWKNKLQHTKSLARGGVSKHGKGEIVSTVSSSLGNKKKSSTKGKEKGKGKEKAQESANVLDISGLLELSITSSKSITFSCYVTSDKVEWFLDSGSTECITPEKSDFIQYREFGQPQHAEITDGKFLTIDGYGTIIRYSIMPNGTALLQIQKVLYVLKANKQLYLLIANAQHNYMSTTMKEGSTVSQNGTPFIIDIPKSGRLHTFDMVLIKNWNEVP